MLALAVIGGGTYGGWRWTQTQYYVGTKDDHLALYRGISQDLAWVSLSKVQKDHPEIELKYLPPYQQKLVEATMPEGDLADARAKIEELAVQASACKKQAERRAAQNAKNEQDAKNEQNAKAGQGQAGGTTGTTPASFTSKASPSPSTSGTPKAPESSEPPSTTAPTPGPGPTLSEEEQKVVSLCGKQ